MVAESMLPYQRQGNRILPEFLGASDVPWLTELIHVHNRYQGLPRRLLEEHLSEPFGAQFPPQKPALARRVLSRIYKTKVVAAVAPKKARAVLFARAATQPGSRNAVVATAAQQLGVTEPQLEQALFADLQSERCLEAPDEVPSPADIALACNQLLLQGLLERSSVVQLELFGNARSVVRHAHLRGLICTRLASHPQRTELQISGPLSIFRRTLLYGRALGELLPYLAWCRSFRLRASVHLKYCQGELEVLPGVPITPTQPPRTFDSKLERRFARDFERATTAWDLVREPEPLQSGASLIFPDFALVRRKQPQERWLLEIVGFWTSEYLRRKLTQLQSLEAANVILCVDEDLRCDEESTREVARYPYLLTFRRRIDPERLLELVSSLSNQTH